MFDYHMHTHFSDDCLHSPEEMLEAAYRMGLTEIAITDHSDPLYPNLEFPFQLDFDAYHSMLVENRLQYSNKLILKYGLELGIQQAALDECSIISNAFPYDFIIASFHMSKGQLLDTGDFFNDRKGFQIHEDFYLDMYQCLKQFKDYSVIGHFNIVDRYLNYLRPEEAINPPGAMEYIREILKMIIYDGKGIEINTSSFRYGLSILTPALEILKVYKELGGEIITIGSDAHTPGHIGHQFKYINELLENFNYKYIATYDSMKPCLLKII